MVSVYASFPKREDGNGVAFGRASGLRAGWLGRNVVTLAYMVGK